MAYYDYGWMIRRQYPSNIDDTPLVVTTDFGEICELQEYDGDKAAYPYAVFPSKEDAGTAPERW